MRRGDADMVAVVPARDEAGRLPAALAALRAGGARVLVVANDCRDATAAVARAHGADVLETGALSGGVGEARHLGIEAALRAGRPRAVLTTDADCVLGPSTLSVLSRALAQADAAFGRVVPDADEFDALPEHVRRHGALEDRCAALMAAVEGTRAAVPWDPLPRHNQSPGALVAFRPDTYRATGGFAAMRCGEDRAMAARLVEIGARVARPWDAVVRASCRRTGRAPGGMADTIAARANADLAAETRRLALACARLERRLARLRAGRSDTRTDLPPEGASHVLSLVQASV